MIGIERNDFRLMLFALGQIDGFERVIETEMIGGE